MSTHSTPHLQHEDVEELLPAYLRGQLSSELQRAVQEHIAHCQQCFLKHQEADKVSQLIQQPPAELEHILTGSRKAENIQRVLAQLASEPSQTDKPKFYQFLVRPFLYWINAYRQAAMSLKMTVAVQFCLLIVAAVVLSQSYMSTDVNLQQSGAVEYRTLSNMPVDLGGKVVDSTRLRVIFEPTTSEQDMRAQLLPLNASVIDGPSDIGVYTIAIPKTVSVGESIKQLRASTSILLVEEAVYQ